MSYARDFRKPYKFKRFKDLIIDKSDKLVIEKKQTGYYLNNHLIVRGRCKIDLLLDYINKSFKVINKSINSVEFQRV